MNVHPAEVSNEEVYVAALRFAFRDGALDGEEMAWMQRVSHLLDIDKDVRRELMTDVKYQARMKQLPPPSPDEKPLDLYRSVCARAWVGSGLGAQEVEVLAEFAQVLGVSRIDAEQCLAETAPTGLVPPSFEGMIPEPRPVEPSTEDDLTKGPSKAGLSPVLVVAVVVAIGVLTYVAQLLL